MKRTITRVRISWVQLGGFMKREPCLGVNRTTSAPISVPHYDLDKGFNFVLEFNIYPFLMSQIMHGGYLTHQNLFNKGELKALAQGGAQSVSNAQGKEPSFS